MTATQPTTMASTSDLRPGPAPAAAPEAAASEAMPRTWFRDHPIQAVLVTALTGLLTAAVVGLSIFSLTALDNKIEKVDTKIDRVEARLTARIDKVEAKVDGLDAKVDEVNLKLTALINELDQKLTTQINEVNLKLTALIAGLEMTGLVDAAVEGRLPGAEPADSEPAGAPG